MSATAPVTLASLEAQLRSTIAQQETAGGKTGVGASLNNPGGLVYSQWEQAYGGGQTSGAFASFPNLQSGYAALTQLIDNYVQGGASIQSMMDAYAPPASNPTTPSRIQTLAQQTGLDPNVPIAQQVTNPGLAAPASPQASASTATPQAAPASPQASASTVTPQATSTASFSLPSASSLLFGLNEHNIVRVSTGIVGIVMLIVGLMMLKQTQVVIQQAQQAGKRVGKFVEAVSA
jgi:hypothetical protein